MEIAGLIVAIVAVVAALASALYAHGANKRADVANQRASEALDLQRRIDERAREFRDVIWVFAWSPWSEPGGPPLLDLTNGGLTTAVDVTLVIVLPSGQQAIHVGTVGPGETRMVEVNYAKPGPAHDHIELIRDPLFRLHWSSPLGHASDFATSARQLG